MATFMSEYQEWTDSTVNYKPEYEMLYLALGLGNEAGEVQGKIKKVFRDNNGVMTTEKREQIADELGDVLWYFARIAYELGYSIEEIAHINQQKLMDRKARGVLKGDGDKR